MSKAQVLHQKFDRQKKKLKLTVIKSNTILCCLLLQKTFTAHRKNKLFMFKKEQSTKNYIKEKRKREIKHHQSETDTL